MSSQARVTRLSRIGVIGLGRIGLPVARNLTAAGFEVFVLDKRPEVAIDFGGWACACAEELADVCEAIIIAVPGPDESVEVLQGVGGILRKARPGLLVINFTTMPVTTSKSFAADAQAAGIAYLEAPISGSEQGAIDGTLTIMTAGEAEAFSQALPILDVLARKIVHIGTAGTAMLLKLINQTVYISYMLAFSEGVAAGEAAGIELDTILDVLGTSAAGDPRIERKFPQMRGDMSQCFSAASAKRYFDFAVAGMEPGVIGQAAHQRLTEAVCAGAGALDVTVLPKHAGSGASSAGTFYPKA